MHRSTNYLNKIKKMEGEWSRAVSNKYSGMFVYWGDDIRVMLNYSDLCTVENKVELLI